jgi:predicted DNA-binding ribbon-helix-helix protein
MPTFEELDALSSQDLHDRAVKLAEHHLDAKFFWDLLKEVPAAEAAAGNVGEADLEVTHLITRVHDLIHPDEKLQDALRPIYIDYLLGHEKN